MDDYLNSRKIREPLGVLDGDLPVDGAEAIVITTADRARDLTQKPVYIHAMSLGGAPVSEYYEMGTWGEQAPWIAMSFLWPKSDIGLADIDLFYPYDGFTPMALAHLEAAGFSKPGETWAMFQDAWSDKEQKLKLLGRTLVHTGGGSLSQGRLGGFNYYAEAARQLRGNETNGRQVLGAKTALISIGSLFHDPAAVILRTD